MPLLVAEENLGDVSVEIVTLLRGRVNYGSEGDLRRCVDQARVGQDDVNQKLVNIGSKIIQIRDSEENLVDRS